MVLVARRLEPGILLVGLQMLKGRFRSRVLRVGLPLIRMLPVLISARILVPGVSHVLGYVARIHGVHFGKIPVEDGPARQEETRRILDASLRKVAVGEEIPQSLAAPKPVAIKPGNRKNVRNVDLIDERLRLAGQLGEKSDSLGIDRRLRL